MAEIRSINVKSSKTDVDVFYEAYLDVDASTLYIRVFDGTLSGVGSPESFGTCTEAELVNRDYQLHVQTFYDPTVGTNEEYALAFGKVRKT